MGDLAQQIAVGIGDGVVYAAFALAIVLIHRTSGAINFAQCELAMLGVFLAWFLIQGGVPVWPAAGIAVVASGLLGMAIQVTLMKPFREADSATVAIVTLGLMFIPAGIAGAIWGYIPKSFPSLFGGSAWVVGTVRIHSNLVGSLVTLGVLVGLLAVVFTKTRIGLAIRAAAQNPGSSRLVGIKVDQMLMLGWGMAGAIGCVAGILAAPTLFVSPTMMLPALLYAFAAASLGGFDSLPGAVVGGLVVGVVESLAGAYIPGVGNELKLLAALVVIVLVLVVRPEGLFSARKVERV
jgi:branched-chain amino acid transport system permease protein